MKNFLTKTERQELRVRHRREKDRRTADRIKAVLLSDSGGAIVALEQICCDDIGSSGA
jgi:hypothetical protein